MIYVDMRGVFCMATRPPGRPRDPVADRAILEATLQLLDEQGYSGLALTEVAERAGVSTATLYRRWSSKGPLVLAAMQSILYPVSLPDTGNTRQDLVLFLQERIQTTQRPLPTKILPALAAEAAGSPEFAEQFRRVQAPIRQVAFTLFDRGIARGDLPFTLDPNLILDLLLGPIAFRQLINGPMLDPTLAPVIVDAILHGVAQT
jgi:AcrR family transcriptional regulator